MDTETWKVFDIYDKLIGMKVRRRGKEVVTRSQLLAAIVVYFLKRHGKEIIDAYADAKYRKKYEKIKTRIPVGSMGIKLDAPAPLYPVPNAPILQKSRTDVVYRRQREKNRYLKQFVRKPAGG